MAAPRLLLLLLTVCLHLQSHHTRYLLIKTNEDGTASRRSNMRNKALPQPGSNLDNESVEPGNYGNNYGSNEPFEPGNDSFEPGNVDNGSYEPGNGNFVDNGSFEPDGNRNNDSFEPGNVDNGSYEPGNG